MCDFFEENYEQEIPLIPPLICALKKRAEETQNEQKSIIDESQQIAEQTLKFSQLFLMQNRVLQHLEQDAITDSRITTSKIYYLLAKTLSSL